MLTGAHPHDNREEVPATTIQLSLALTVSVIIPVKDDAVVLAACLRALSGQSVSPCEILVIDNGSIDDSAEVARRSGARVLFQSRPGIGAASDTGYDNAQGDIIARIDADTQLPAQWIETLLADFHTHPTIDVITGGAQFTDGPRPVRTVASAFYLGSYYLLAGLALTHAPVFGSNFAMRRTAWLDVRSEIHESDRIHDDFDLSFHLGRHHRIRYRHHLRSGISMRPFFDGKGAVRIRRGVSTVLLHWPDELPWLRVARRVIWRCRLRRRPRQSLR